MRTGAIIFLLLGLAGAAVPRSRAAAPDRHPPGPPPSGAEGRDQAGPDEARLLRFPAVHGDRLVFTYAGDLYAAPAAGGVARKQTNHDGVEMFARFAPD